METKQLGCQKSVIPAIKTDIIFVFTQNLERYRLSCPKSRPHSRLSHFTSYQDILWPFLS